MVNTLIFDFGNVFINLDLEHGIKESLKALKVPYLPEDVNAVNIEYEIGAISTTDFISFYKQKFPHLTKLDIINLWNIILKDFPEYRLDFLKTLKLERKYQLILLSNSSELHIDWIKSNISFYNEFRNCFDAFYLSHQIQLRKPNTDIFKFVLNTHNLNPEDCIFIDDNADNIKTAAHLNFKTWHITPYKDDIIHLFSNKRELF